MKRFKSLIILTCLLGLLGCNRCNFDCFYDEPFVFELIDSGGDNVLNNGTLSIEQVSITSGNKPNELLYLEPQVNMEGDTLIEFFLLRYEEDYLLEIEGFGSSNLRFDISINKSDCCGDIIGIEEAFLNDNPIPKDNSYIIQIEN